MKTSSRHIDSVIAIWNMPISGLNVETNPQLADHTGMRQVAPESACQIDFLCWRMNDAAPSEYRE